MLGEQVRERQDPWNSMLKKKNIVTNDIFTRGHLFIVIFLEALINLSIGLPIGFSSPNLNFLLQVRKKNKKIYGLDLPGIYDASKKNKNKITPFDLKIILKRRQTRKQIETRAKKFTHVRHETICAIMSRKLKRQENQ